jgi:hypothetical protein
VTTQKPTRAKAKTSRSVSPVLSVDPASLKDFQSAHASLGRSLAILRCAHAALQDQCNERVEGVGPWDHHVLIRQGWEGLDSASADLFNISGGDKIAEQAASAMRYASVARVWTEIESIWMLLVVPAPFMAVGVAPEPEVELFGCAAVGVGGAGGTDTDGAASKGGGAPGAGIKPPPGCQGAAGCALY